jgi:hypothetical protein
MYRLQAIIAISAKHRYGAARLAPVVGILAILTALALATGAHAGTYVINDCPSAPGSPSDSGPWTVFGAPQNTKGSCSGGPGNWIGPEGGYMGPATLDGVQVAAPAGSGITIRAARVWWFVPQQVSGATTFAIASANTGIVEEAATPKNSAGTPDVWTLASNTTELTLADYCSNSDAGNGCTFGSGENPNLELFGAQLTLSDNNLPSATVTGGALAGAGPLAGPQSLTFNASDADTGVRAAQLLIDGKVLAQKDYLAQCPYTNFVACPLSRSDALSWNTSTVANGSHELALQIVNAAGNTTISGSHTITTNGAGGPSGPHIPNGQSPCAGETLSLLVNGRAKPPVVSYGETVTIKGVLHCASVPVRDARVLVVTSGGPPKAAINGAVQTAADGSFSYKVPKGPDRKLRFSYIAYSDETTPSATATANILVRPRIKLQITPHRTRNEHSIHWAGAISGGPYPKQGVTLDVEVRIGRVWKVFDQVEANAKGRFHYSYRFHATEEPTTYSFRVALPNNGAQGYPYTSGSSNTVNIHVAP